MSQLQRRRKIAPVMIVGGLALIVVGVALPRMIDGLPEFFPTLVIVLGSIEAAIGSLLRVKTPSP